jgi:hypothetical protein
MKKKSKPMKFALCLNNKGYPASLEVGKIYCVIPDDQAAAHGYLRVIDESGEDYAFKANRFVPMKLPLAAKKVLLSKRQKVVA